MTNTDIEAILAKLGIALPVPPAPVGGYVPFVITGTTLYIAGQLPLHNGSIGAQGLIGDNLARTEGQKAARYCAINILAQAKAALVGDLGRIVRVVKLAGFMTCGANFYDHAQVMDGASDLMVKLFGEAGRHTRTSVGVASLPRGATVEIDAVFEIAAS